mgnify:CR=1 FL=1
MSRAIGAAWRGAGDPSARKSGRSGGSRARLRSRCLPAASERCGTAAGNAAAPAVYLLVSHHHLEKRSLIARLKARSAVRFICLIHDLIPIEFPEYAKPGQAETPPAAGSRPRSQFADALIVNSAVTRDALQPHLDRAGRARRCSVAPLRRRSSEPLRAIRTPPFDRPYFVYVSTIEARKNHLLLLNLWRQLATELGDARAAIGAGRPARLGNRERRRHARPLPGAARRGHRAQCTCPIGEMVRLVKGARALLLPSFAEGFGFPLIEALELGVPALCSDIPALRETGGTVPEFLDPLDGPGWRTAILDYAAPASPRRAAQLERLTGWAAAALGPIISPMSTASSPEAASRRRRCADEHSANATPASSVRGAAPRPPGRSGSAATARASSSRMPTASRTCASAVLRRSGRSAAGAARSGTAG